MTGVSLRCLTLYGRGGGCKVSADMDEELGDPGSRRRSSASEDGIGLTWGKDEATIDCFSNRMEKFFRSNRRLLRCNEVERSNSMSARLPDDILEMCLVRLPLASLLNARRVCKKWRNLTTTPRFMQIRREGLFQSLWFFLFGVLKNGNCSGEIHALYVSQNQWHKIDSQILKGRFFFSVASIHDDVYVVGGCSSLTNFGRVDRSSFKTHKGVLVFSPLTKSWRKAAAMKYARSSPVLGISEMFIKILRLSVRRPSRHSLEENEISSLHTIKPCKFTWQKHESSSSKGSKKYPEGASRFWCGLLRCCMQQSILCLLRKRQVCWIRHREGIPDQNPDDFKPTLSARGDGQIGRRNKAVRKLWKLDLMQLKWTEESTHPDAPMEWNAAFIADDELIFGVEMFRVFGQVLNFVTVFDVSDARTGCNHISRNHTAHDLDVSSCMTKSMTVLRL
ncbi:hypothetical protein C2S51_019994 [Perilla frutescens var. frutescens]|nr:hypothetical protein C2S51_019994 [Perilla frutescens var. frutescens]